MLSRKERKCFAENMRINPTRHEKIFRDRLDVKKIRYKCQHLIGHYIVDFLIGKTVIEIDGGSHNTPEAKEYDDKRTDLLNCYGYTVVRIKNKDVEFVNINALLSVKPIVKIEKRKKKEKLKSNKPKKGSERRNIYIQNLQNGMETKEAIRIWKGRTKVEMDDRFNMLVGR